MDRRLREYSRDDKHRFLETKVRLEPSNHKLKIYLDTMEGIMPVFAVGNAKGAIWPCKAEVNVEKVEDGYLYKFDENIAENMSGVDRLIVKGTSYREAIVEAALGQGAVHLNRWDILRVRWHLKDSDLWD